MTTHFNDPRINYLMKILLFILLCIFFSVMCSCSPQVRAKKKLQRVEKLIRKAKYLDPSISTIHTVIVRDTLITEAVKHDTTFIDVGDTVILQKDKLTVRYVRDTVTNLVRIDGECEGDTVIKTIQIPKERLIIKSKESTFKWWHWVLLGVVLVPIWKFIFRTLVNRFSI